MAGVARPRVIITSPDANVTVKLIASLNPRRYRIEHIHDLSEALLRAELVLAHAAVVHLDEVDDAIQKRLQRAIEHGLSLVLVSHSASAAHAAAAIGAHHLRQPFEVHEVKRKVLDAVSEAHAQRGGDAVVSSRRDSRPQPHQRVLLLVAEPEAGEIMASLLRGQLGVDCSSVRDTQEAVGELERGFDCLVARPGLLLGDAHGATLARKLARRGVAVVPLGAGEALDSSSAGQVAWELVPQIRRSLLARERILRSRPRD